MPPLAPAASCPLPPPPRAWTKHRADGLTRRRSDLSLPARSSSSLLPLLADRCSSGSLLILRVLLPRSPLQQPSARRPSFYTPCATLHHPSRAPVVPYPLILSSSLLFLISSCIFVFFFKSAFLFPFLVFGSFKTCQNFPQNDRRLNLRRKRERRVWKK